MADYVYLQLGCFLSIRLFIYNLYLDVPHISQIWQGQEWIPGIPCQTNFSSILSYFSWWQLFFSSGSSQIPRHPWYSHSLTHHSQARGRFRHEYLQNACITWSFPTISMALTLIQDISHLDNCNSLLKWFSKFCSCTLLSLLNTLRHPLNKIQIFPFSAPNLLKTSHHNYSKIQSPSDGQPGLHKLTINSISDIAF